MEVSSRTFGAIVEAIGAILSRSKTNRETGFSHLGGHKVVEKELDLRSNGLDPPQKKKRIS